MQVFNNPSFRSRERKGTGREGQGGGGDDRGGDGERGSEMVVEVEMADIHSSGGQSTDVRLTANTENPLNFGSPSEPKRLRCPSE